ncbi:mCG145941, partial [Mus musculus]
CAYNLNQTGNKIEWPTQPCQAEWEHIQWAQRPNTAEYGDPVLSVGADVYSMCPGKLFPSICCMSWILQR